MTDITPLLVELEQLLALATPGTWRVGESNFLGTGILPSTGEMRTEGGPIVTCWEGCIGKPETVANAELIALAKSALPALITAYRAERMRADAAEAALVPFARIADMEECAGQGDSIMVNVARCRDARAALNPDRMAG